MEKLKKLLLFLLIFPSSMNIPHSHHPRPDPTKTDSSVTSTSSDDATLQSDDDKDDSLVRVKITGASGGMNQIGTTPEQSYDRDPRTCFITAAENKDHQNLMLRFGGLSFHFRLITVQTTPGDGDHVTKGDDNSEKTKVFVLYGHGNEETAICKMGRTDTGIFPAVSFTSLLINSCDLNFQITSFLVIN